MPTRLCSNPRCDQPAHYRGKCRRHATQRERDTNRAGRKVYNSAKWQRTRRLVLFLNPLCECGAISEDIHHKQDLADGGAPYDQANLSALCHSCHSRLTRSSQGATP